MVLQLLLKLFVSKFVYLAREVKKSKPRTNHCCIMPHRLHIAITCLLCFIVFSVNAQVNFIIESLPSTTPKEDTIFISGTFNNWQVNDVSYMLHPQLDGKYSISLPIDTGIIEFKFCRGSWLKVETNKTNEYLQNRTIDCGKQKTYIARIENWQDLGGVEEFNYVVLLLFAIGFYGISILFFAIRIQYRSFAFKPFFFSFNIALIISLIGIVFYNQANFIWQSRIGMVGLVLLFLWGPLFRFFIKSLVLEIKLKTILFHFLPALFVVLVAIFRFLNFEPLDFYANEINSELILGNLIVVWLGILSTLIYHLSGVKSLIQLYKARARYPKKSQFVSIVYFISSSALLYLIITFILLQTEIKLGINSGIELMLILLSVIMFVEFYYYWKYPAIFHKTETAVGRVKYNGNVLVSNYENIEQAKQNHPKTSLQKLPEELSNELKGKLKKQMLVEKAFKDPKLNIAGLSEIIDTKPHILSRVLNEQFNKNFRDYINEYRIKEFIELASSQKYKNYTLLALSYEVGFNSKSTFNLAFKKVTGLSPRNFLRNSEIKIGD